MAAYDPEHAITAIAAIAARGREWTQIDHETWSYVPRSWQWRVTVTAGSRGITWEFRSMDGTLLPGGGQSTDVAAMRRAVKAGPATAA